MSEPASIIELTGLVCTELDEGLTFLASARFAPLPAELAQRVAEAVQRPSQLVALHVDGPVASGASQLRVVFQPSQLLLELVATLRALEVDGLVVQQHNPLPECAI